MNKKQNERIYLDNAATTKIDEDVLKAMLPYLSEHYGNPSSIHHLGRETRIAIEGARKKIASLLNVKPASIIFTSGGTESNNTAINSAIRDFECNHIITSKIEHHAVLHTVEYYAAKNNIGISYVELTEDGNINREHFRKTLEMRTAQGKKCFVSLMHANNETGQFNEIRWISSLCKKHNAIFHSDCVQTIGHYPVNLSLEGVHFASASAHKFHGPKGVGFLYVHDSIHTSPLIFGGGQESGYRAGTENVASIVGMAAALELALTNYSADQEYISGLKQYLATFLKSQFKGCIINSGRFSLYTVLSVSFPKSEKTEMLLMELDQKGICAAGGSACSGGGSHVMKELGKDKNYVTIRFSFSKYNTRAEMDKAVEVLQEILEVDKPVTHNS